MTAKKNSKASKTARTNKPSTDPLDILATLVITKQTGRLVGGVWVTGIIANHTFDALVFPEHAESESYELDQSRISKLNLRERGSVIDVANFDRGWDVKPTTPAAKAIVDVLAAGLAEHVFGK